MSTEPDQCAPPNGPDASAISEAGLTRRRLGSVDGTRVNGFQVVMSDAAARAMREHAHSRRDVEVCGILAGQLFRDVRGAYLLIDAALPGHAASERGASVTITAETWESVNATLEEEHPDLKICGWFHTHPNFGIFLSEPDVFIHRSFFDLPWQPAIVIDPVKKDEGCFIWRGGSLVREPMLVERPRGGTKWAVSHQAEAHAGRGRLARLLGGPTGVGPVRLALIVLLTGVLLAAAGFVGWAAAQGWDASTWMQDAMEGDDAPPTDE